jgi:hypothetical protein
MEIVVSTNLSLLFNALVTMFIFRLLYFHHARDYWSDWRMWVLGSIVFVPVLTHIYECQQVFFSSSRLECPMEAPPGFTSIYAGVNMKMEALLQSQTELVAKSFVLWVGTLLIMLSTLVIFIRDFQNEMERQRRLNGGANVDVMSAFYMIDGLT